MHRYALVFLLACSSSGGEHDTTPDAAAEDVDSGAAVAGSDAEQSRVDAGAPVPSLNTFGFDCLPAIHECGCELAEALGDSTECGPELLSAMTVCVNSAGGLPDESPRPPGSLSDDQQCAMALHSLLTAADLPLQLCSPEFGWACPEPTPPCVSSFDCPDGLTCVCRAEDAFGCVASECAR